MIYVLVPAHNEAPTVGLLLWKVRQLFTSFNREYQLIVVNDGSTDATEEILAPYTRALPLTLLTHRKRQGYARSLEALLREAVKRTDRPRRDIAVTIQADFSEAPEDVLELIKKLEGGADIVVADRRGRSGATRTESFVRRLLPRLVRSRLHISGADDVVGTMRGYRLATIERLVREAGDRTFLSHQGWAADLELLARAVRHARRVESVPVNSPRPESARPSRLAPLREAWQAFRASAALKGLPMPTLALDDVAEATESVVAADRETADQRRGRGERGDRQGQRHGRDRHEGRRKEQRRHQDQRPRQERRPATDQKAKEVVIPLEPAAAAPPGAAEAGDAPNAIRAEGGGKRRRRRRGRGRGRGRGPGPQGQPGQGPDRSAQQPPGPPPAA